MSEDEKSLRVGAIFLRLTQLDKRFDELVKTDVADVELGAIEAEETAMFEELHALGLSQLDINKLIAASTHDPVARREEELLYIEHPALPGEGVRDHMNRVLGPGTFEWYQNAAEHLFE